MQYVNVFKVLGVVHVILAFLKLLQLLLKLLRRWLLRVLVLGLLRWINVYSRSQRQKQVQHIHIHANNSIYSETVQRYMKIANKTMLELFYALQ